MSDGQDTLIQTLAKAMADDRKVLLVEPSFELLSLMAVSAVKELAVVTADADPDAPAGETGTGAPLRIRADYAERPRSKDLIIDPQGNAPPEAIDRLLKKHGVYLTCVDNAVTESLPVVTQVTPHLFGTATVGKTPAKLTIKTKEHAGNEGPSIAVASRLPFEPPTVTFPLDLSAVSEASTLRESLETVRNQLEQNELVLEDTRDELTESVGRNDALSTECETLRTALDGAASTAERTETDLSALRTEFTELESDYEQLRTLLAEQRIADQRDQRLNDRAEVTQRDLTKEIEELRARLVKLDAPAAELNEIIEERNVLRERLRDATNGCHEIASILVAGKALPTPPAVGAQPSQATALAHWLTQLTNRAEATSTRQAERDSMLRSLKSKTTRLERKVRLLETLSPPADPAVIEVVAPVTQRTEAGPEIDALKGALDAERELRNQAEQRADGAHLAASRAVEHYNQLRDNLILSRREKIESDVARVVAEERLEQLKGEIQERAGRMAELEAMLATHHHLHGLMADTVRDAESARDEADSARRLAEANLDVLRGEFERLNEASDAGHSSRA